MQQERIYSSPEICRLAEISFRQLDYWTRQQLIIPMVGAHGSGSRRCWSSADALMMQTASRLRRTGVPLRVAVAIALALRERVPDRPATGQIYAVVTVAGVEIAETSDLVGLLGDGGWVIPLWAEEPQAFVA